MPLDILEFSILTPLPGSEDHAKAVAKGVDIDPDLNKFDLEHVTTDHPRMSRKERQEAHRLAWRTYFIEDDIKTVIRRAVVGGPRPDTVAYLLTWFRASFHFYDIYPLETGIFRSDTVATAGRVFRARTRFSFMRATGAGRSSPTAIFSQCSPGFTYGSAGSNAIPRSRPILTRRCGRTTTTIRRCTSSSRPRARQPRRPSKRLEEHNHTHAAHAEAVK